jgi:Zn-dependent M28 family amino/carboxypeptidase
MREAGLIPLDNAESYVTEISIGRTYKTWNVSGVLAGTDPRRRADTVLLTAHLDHLGTRYSDSGGRDVVFNGADDDASGVAAVLELMAVLSSSPRAARSVVFVCFGSEEKGMVGSRHFVESGFLRTHNPIANLQFEMVGRPSGRWKPSLWLAGYERSNLGVELQRRGAFIVPDPLPAMGFFYRSDSVQLARRGIVAHTVSAFRQHDDYHTVDDEVELIDFLAMATTLNSLVAPIQWLANSTFQPRWIVSPND